MTQKKKIFFASDFHLGTDSRLSSKDRELKLVNWLDEIKSEAEEIILLGDIFDYWFEYKQVIPRGYSAFIGKLAELRRENVKISFFTGNHDMWMFGYFEQELGIPVHRKPVFRQFGNKKFYLLHGDGLPTDRWINRLMQKTFSNPVLQWAFARLHPNLALGIMKYLSHRSRLAHEVYDYEFVREKEHMIDYSNQFIKANEDVDFIVMGHRHLPVDYLLDNAKTRHINLGDWVHHFSFAVFDGDDLQIQFYENEHEIHSA